MSAATSAEDGGGAAAIARCVSDIEMADVVALDLEFSGLFLNAEKGRETLSMEDYFIKCVDSVPQFLPLQLGICCARRRERDGVWELRSHEFNLWPQGRRVFSADMQSLKFLRANGFDFNAFFDDGFVCARCPAKGASPSLFAGRRGHAGSLFRALGDAAVPLVVHNGLLDLLHLYDKFAGELPRTPAGFAAAWLERFPRLFDTRYIAQAGRSTVLKQACGLSLEELNRDLVGAAAGTPGQRGSLQFERLGPVSADASAHGSAGKDAMLTAEVFIAEIELWLRAVAGTSSSPLGAASDERRHRDNDIFDLGGGAAASDAADKASRKRRRTGAAGDGASAKAHFVSPKQQLSAEALRPLENVVAIVGATVTSFRLG